MKIKGLRTNHTTGETSEVELGFYFQKDSNDVVWLHLTGGSTGYESAMWDSLIQRAQKLEEGAVWGACFGAKGRYDSLDVPMSEILRIHEAQCNLEHGDGIMP